MIVSLCALWTGVAVFLLYRDARTQGIACVVISPFWYFSFLFWVAFPVRAWLIDEQAILLQSLPKVHSGQLYPQDTLAIALILSIALWALVLLGRTHTRSNLREGAPDQEKPATPMLWRPYIGLGLMAGVAIAGVWLLGDRDIAAFDGPAYQSSRMGSGPLWLAPELFVYAALGFLGYRLTQSNAALNIQDWLIFFAVLGLSYWVSQALFTRRLLAAVLLAFTVFLTLRRNRLWPLTLAGVLGTVWAAPVLDIVRRLTHLNEHKQTVSIDAVFRTVFDNHFELFLASAFEGIEHIARLVEKATFGQLLGGIDHGVSWAFNAGLALVPRAIWSGKPLSYGGTEQMHWLYPELFQDGFATAGIPMSFAVDFTFGFGVVFALIMAYAFGRLMGASERLLWSPQAKPAQLAVSLFLFVFMFNWVRGGTIVVQSVALFSIPLLILFGWRSTLQALLGLAGETIGLKAWGTPIQPCKVFFYPHAYLRDRQIDTVRNWPDGQADNADVMAKRIGSHVSREAALSSGRPSWKTRLPLINLKRRPQDTPEDSAVYVWGGIIANGPFITDIDNPYAFTAYNPLALKLYRPLIKALLEREGCLQIRCLSQACKDGVAREFGPRVAQKAVVAYPHLPAPPTTPNPQRAEQCNFLFVSTQFEIKGGAALLNAFETVRKAVPDATLTLVTHLPDQYQDHARAMPGVEVHEAHFTRDEIAHRYLKNAHVLVHPTYFDSFAMIVLEAIAHGLPVIATSVYAIPEMVEDKRNGVLLDPPLSIWSGTQPSDLFSDIAKVTQRIGKTNTQAFENALAHAMISMAQNIESRKRAGTESLNLYQTRFAGPA